MSQKRYCRVDFPKGIIVEPYVTEEIIKNRGHRVEDYTLIGFEVKPNIPEFHYAKEILTIRGNRVDGSYEVTKMSLVSLLRQAHGAEATEPKPIEEIAPNLLRAIMDSMVSEAEKEMDNFAKTRGYDSIKSAGNYRDSPISKYKVEGTTAYRILNETWEALEVYSDKVMSKELPVPMNYNEVRQHLPALSWD